jgi:putative transcriptional regulator
MPTFVNLEPALLEWQAKHKKRMTYESLAQRAGISIAALYRIKSGNMITPDLRKINALCKVLECEPGDLIVRESTGPSNDLTTLEVERTEILKDIQRKSKKRSKAIQS